MSFRWHFIVAMLCAGAAHVVHADESLAQRNVCLACHQVEAKRVGPSFRDIAIRYAGNEAAAKYLAQVIRDGSRGRWGAIPMPAQGHVNAATALELAQWILSLAPAQITDGAAEEHGGSAAIPGVTGDGAVPRANGGAAIPSGTGSGAHGNGGAQSDKGGS